MNLIEEIVKDLIVHFLLLWIDELHSIKEEIENESFLIDLDLFYLHQLSTPELINSYIKTEIEVRYLHNG